jgi:hypothetical protein
MGFSPSRPSVDRSVAPASDKLRSLCCQGRSAASIRQSHTGRNRRLPSHSNRLERYNTVSMFALSDSRCDRRLLRRRGRYPRHQRVSPDYSNHLSDVPCPLPRRIKRVHMSIASPLMQPSPIGRRIGIRIVTFEACSGFTHVTARRIAQPPYGDLCREAPTQPVTRPSCSLAVNFQEVVHSAPAVNADVAKLQ